MLKAPAIPNENLRLSELRRYEIMNTLKEESFDDLAYLASSLFGAPIALVSLVGETQQWFKARIGTEETGGAREDSFCGHAIAQKGVFVVEDAEADERFFDNPWVTEKDIRFYAGAPLETSEGLSIGTLCVLDKKKRGFSDLDRKSLEALARQVIQLLELRIKLKQLSLKEAELVLANRRIENAAEQKNRFFANISHEIRTPINGILGMAELALVNEASSVQKERLEIIQSSSRTLLTIVNDILDHAKLEAGKFQLESEAYSVHTLGQHVFKMMKPLAEKKQLELQFHVDRNLPAQLMGDETRISQVLMNLLSNAIKFTSKGHVELKISASDAGKSVTFSVADSGIGISPENQEKLFQSFAQLENSTARVYGGTGLGLAIAKALVEQMGGSMRVESESNVGSTFSFKLPQVAVTSAREQAPAKQTKRLKVLLADDNVINQKIFATYLQTLEHDVVIADDGEAVLRILDESDFDLILMDCQMPNLDGFQTTKRIRALKSAKRLTPILAITADVENSAQDRCLEVGKNGCLPKPIQLAGLAQALELALLS